MSLCIIIVIVVCVYNFWTFILFCWLKQIICWQLAWDEWMVYAVVYRWMDGWMDLHNRCVYIHTVKSIIIKAFKHAVFARDLQRASPPTDAPTLRLIKHATFVHCASMPVCLHSASGGSKRARNQSKEDIVLFWSSKTFPIKWN